MGIPSASGSLRKRGAGEALPQEPTRPLLTRRRRQPPLPSAPCGDALSRRRMTVQREMEGARRVEIGEILAGELDVEPLVRLWVAREIERETVGRTFEAARQRHEERERHELERR